MSFGVILAVGHDYSLLSSRSAVLRSEGYVVTSATSTLEAIDQFWAGDFDIVVLCHSVPFEDREILRRFIRSTGSVVPILCVMPNDESVKGEIADSLVESNPDELLAAIKRSLDGELVRYARGARVAELSDRDGETDIHRRHASS
jgi:DNA-binding response OmpR family regulator